MYSSLMFNINHSTHLSERLRGRRGLKLRLKEDRKTQEGRRATTVTKK